MLQNEPFWLRKLCVLSEVVLVFVLQGPCGITNVYLTSHFKLVFKCMKRLYLVLCCLECIHTTVEQQVERAFVRRFSS